MVHRRHYCPSQVYVKKAQLDCEHLQWTALLAAIIFFQEICS